MKIVAAISVTRNDGVTLSQEIRTETQRVWDSSTGTFKPETKVDTKRRFERLLRTAVNSTLGR